MDIDVSQVAADLAAEQQDLDDLLSPIDPPMWATGTASQRWTIADQIGHLAYFDGTAALAITDPDAFRAHIPDLLANFGDEVALDTATLGPFRAMSPEQLLTAWRANRARLADAAETLENDTRVVWYGPSMGAKSFLTARLMECWAHGQDAVDAAELQRSSTDRIAHIVRLGVITRGWSYINRKLEPPMSDVYVGLTSPTGTTWVFGDADATERIVGSAEDFCLVVTQRRHVDATGLAVEGDDARDWMLKAQAFAGPVTDGPAA